MFTASNVKSKLAENVQVQLNFNGFANWRGMHDVLMTAPVTVQDRSNYFMHDRCGGGTTGADV